MKSSSHNLSIRLNDWKECKSLFSDDMSLHRKSSRIHKNLLELIKEIKFTRHLIKSQKNKLYFSILTMAPHSSTLAWKIPWTEEPGRLLSMGLLRVGHKWATSLSRIGGGNGNPLQCSCLENPRDGGAWWAAVYGVAQSRTRLKQLSSSSSILTKNMKRN